MSVSRQQRSLLMTLQWFIAFVAIWTVYHVLLQSASVIDNDSAEAYVWGREFQFGYYEHPPLWAWISGAWFLVFPRTSWAYALLININAALGLIGAWRLIGCFARGERQTAATLLLLLTPFYTVFNDRFGGNTIFLSLWPWTAYFFVRSFQTRRFGEAIGFGIFAGLDMLSKYYAILLLVTCLVAALQHPGRKAYFRSASPYVSVLAATILFLPHLLWLQANAYLPLHYVQAVSDSSWADTILAVESLVGWYFGGQIILFAVLLWAGRPALGGLGSRMRRLAADPDFRLMAILCLLPSILTVVFTIVYRVHLSERTGLGLFCLVPLLLMDVLEIQPSEGFVRRAAWTAGLSALFAAAISYGLAYESMKTSALAGKGEVVQPRRELAEHATEIWRTATHTPLRYVSGPFSLAESIAFYSADAPSEFIEMTFRYAPWVTPNALSERGLLIVCQADNAVCLNKVRVFMTPDMRQETVSLTHTFAGIQGPSKSYVLTIVPPHNKAAWSKLGPVSQEWFFNDGAVRNAKASP
jgi:4-amino-4-deoxy-L-arabinose transferase-like glycosyltransferase